MAEASDEEGEMVGGGGGGSGAGSGHRGAMASRMASSRAVTSARLGREDASRL